MRTNEFSRLALVAGVFISLTGCVTTDEAVPQGNAAELAPAAFPQETETMQQPETVKYYRSDEPLKMAYEHYNRGHFGIAERYFQDAVELTPKDAAAWIGLAACYDRIGRFELADRAYATVIRMSGETTEILNNEGYSYILRGDLRRARQKLLLAQARDPNNPTIANNLKLLDSSHRFVRRPESNSQQQ
jgi:Flp pilus assembly protein TadD